MNDAVYRIGAVVRTDLKIRLRRTSTVVLLLLLCAMAYGFVPDLATGKALMQIDGQRALYNSATIAIVTAALCSVILGMIGFYLVSSTVRRDTVSRTGFVIAAMPVRSVEYLAGKFLGNACFLALVVLGYLLNVMGMHLLRGEAPIEPLVYLATFAVMTGPAIVVVSAFALMFECVPLLSGRLGDLLYFFVWIAMIATVAGSERVAGGDWRRFADVFGMAFMSNQVSGGVVHHSMSIGSTTFEETLPVWTWGGIRWSIATVAPRLVTALAAVPLLLVAWLAFVRFDPAKIRGGTTHGPLNPLGFLNRKLKPVTRILAPLAGRGQGIGRVVVGDLVLTFMLSPVALLWLAIATIAALVVPTQALTSTILPITFLGLVTAISDIVPRDRAAGTTALLYSMPRVREHYIGAKLLTTIGTTLVFVLVPLLRLLLTSPSSALSLVIGAVFTGCLAAGLGTLTGGPKAFAGLFLLFMYAVMNSSGDPHVDFAGFQGTATSTVRAGYAGIALLFAVAALIRGRAGKLPG